MNKNKFLDLYPQLWEPKVGVKVKIVKILTRDKKPTDNWNYKIGDTGEIIHVMSLTRYTLYQVKFHKNQKSFWAYKEEFIQYHE